MIQVILIDPDIFYWEMKGFTVVNTVLCYTGATH